MTPENMLRFYEHRCITGGEGKGRTPHVPPNLFNKTYHEKAMVEVFSKL